MFSRVGGRLVAAVSVAMLGSCGSEDAGVPVFPVRGTLLVDGEPAEGALVVLHSLSPENEATKPSGRVQADGTFRLTTFETGDGAPAGEYAVTIFWPEPPKSPVERPDMGPDRLKNRYTNPESSDIRVAVSEGENVLDPIRVDTDGRL